MPIRDKRLLAQGVLRYGTFSMPILSHATFSHHLVGSRPIPFLTLSGNAFLRLSTTSRFGLGYSPCMEYLDLSQSLLSGWIDGSRATIVPAPGISQ